MHAGELRVLGGLRGERKEDGAEGGEVSHG
jgi:hypothetical protein